MHGGFCRDFSIHDIIMESWLDFKYSRGKRGRKAQDPRVKAQVLQFSFSK